MNGCALQATTSTRMAHMSTDDRFESELRQTDIQRGAGRKLPLRMRSLKWLKLSVNPIQRWTNLFSQLLPKVNE